MIAPLWHSGRPSGPSRHTSLPSAVNEVLPRSSLLCRLELLAKSVAGDAHSIPRAVRVPPVQATERAVNANSSRKRVGIERRRSHRRRAGWPAAMAGLAQWSSSVCSRLPSSAALGGARGLCAKLRRPQDRSRPLWRLRQRVCQRRGVLRRRVRARMRGRHQRVRWALHRHRCRSRPLRCVRQRMCGGPGLLARQLCPRVRRRHDRMRGPLCRDGLRSGQLRSVRQCVRFGLGVLRGRLRRRMLGRHEQVRHPVREQRQRPRPLRRMRQPVPERPGVLQLALRAPVLGLDDELLRLLRRHEQ